jgi:hypothetical protein
VSSWRLARRRREVETGLARFYQEMVAKAAWLATKRNATPKILQALAGYATAIRRIGQGTGPNATRYRRDAREMMFDAAGAVPCWIMSHNRISEAMPADIGAFDLVIVDEASQSDLVGITCDLEGQEDSCGRRRQAGLAGRRIHRQQQDSGTPGPIPSRSAIWSRR